MGCTLGRCEWYEISGDRCECKQTLSKRLCEYHLQQFNRGRYVTLKDLDACQRMIMLEALKDRWRAVATAAKIPQHTIIYIEGIHKGRREEFLLEIMEEMQLGKFVSYIRFSGLYQYFDFLVRLSFPPRLKSSSLFSK